MHMTKEVVATTHEYIRDNDLINLVESRTKAKWCGVGSRSTYYNAVRKKQAGEDVNLVEYLMLQEAHAISVEHSKSLIKELG